MVRIPAEYQEVEYLESTGTQWINTGIPLNTIADERTNWNLQFSPTSVSKTRILCGADESEKQVVLLSNGVIRKDWAIPGRTGFSKTLLVGGIYLISQTDGLFKLQSTEEDAETEQITRTTSSNYPFALFAKTTNENGTAVENSTIAFMKLYSFNAFNGDSDICNFIPCYRKSDSEPGMYDTVTKQFFTNAGTGEFIVGNDVSLDTASLIERRRQILLNTPHLETISDTIASFKTDVPALIKDCKVYFTPVQEGSGDPSPDNVRPISGWDGVTVYKTRKNLLVKDEITFTNNLYIGSTGNIVSTRYYKISNAIPCGYIAGKTVTFNTITDGYGPSITSMAFYLSDTISADNCVLTAHRENNSSPMYLTVTVPLTAKYMVFTLNKANTLNGRYIVEGTEPPNEVDTPTTITIPFPQTIYGGYADLVKGEVVAEWALLEPAAVDGIIKPYAWVYVGAYGTIDGTIAPKSNLLTKTNGTAGKMQDNEFNVFNSSGYERAHAAFRFENISLTSASYNEKLSELREAGTPLQFAYKLATPNTYQLDPEVIKTLKGTNNIWSNANGNIEVKFWKH